MSVRTSGITPAMSASARSGRATSPSELDRAVDEVRARAGAVAALRPPARALLLRACMAGVAAVAEDWGRTAARAKGLAWGTPAGADNHRATHRVVPKLVQLEARPGWGRFLGVAANAVPG